MSDTCILAFFLCCWVAAGASCFVAHGDAMLIEDFGGGVDPMLIQGKVLISGFIGLLCSAVMTGGLSFASALCDERVEARRSKATP